MSNMPKPKPAVHYGNISVKPEEVGYDADRLTKLDEMMIDLIIQERLQSASYMLSRYGKVFAYRSMGKLSYRDESPDFAPDSIRRLASVTKLFTAISIMKLVEDGKLYLDQPVSSILSEFDTDMHRKISIFHLMTHTSGICTSSGYFFEPYTTSWWDILDAQTRRYEESGKDPSMKPNWIKAALSGPVRCKPGEEWNYSTVGFLILGEIIKRITGIHCEDFIMDNICKPLGMTETFFDVPEPLHPGVCHTNEWSEKSITQKRETNDDGPSRSAGGLFSTLADLHTFGQMFLNNGTYNGARIVGRKSIEAMTRRQLKGVPAYYWSDDHKDMKFGLGVNLLPSDLLTPGTYNHDGAGRCYLFVDPAESFVAVCFVPSELGWVYESIINTRSVIWSGIK